MTTPAVAAPMGQAFHFNTYGGNALGSAVGLAVLQVGGRVRRWSRRAEGGRAGNMLEVCERIC